MALSTTQRRVLVALCRPYKGRSGFASPATDEQIAEELFLSVGEVEDPSPGAVREARRRGSQPAESARAPRRAGIRRRPDLRARPLGRCSSPGSTFAGYEVESVVGAGGIGILYRARQLRLDRPVALKLVEPEVARDPVVRERLRREARAVAALDHPNVVPLYEAGEEDGTVYIVTRWVEGTELGTLIHERRPDGAGASGADRRADRRRRSRWPTRRGSSTATSSRRT